MNTENNVMLHQSLKNQTMELHAKAHEIPEINGIPDVRNSTENWLKNRDVFPENWILAIDKTYNEIELLLDVKL